MFSTSPTPAMSVPLTSIQATLERHISLIKGYLPPHIPSNAPLFDTTLPSSTTSASIEDFASRISSLGLPVPLASEVTKLITQESEQYGAFVEQIRLRQLHELSATSVSSDPSSIPALIGAACNSFRELLIKSGIEEIQQLGSTQESAGSDIGEQSNFEDGSDSSSNSEDESDVNEEAFDDGEEDDNAPIKPGEDIPPLDTKYLPIFEALHERGKVLTKPEKTYLVNMTGMTYRQITIWFQNRRRGELKENTIMASCSKASSTHSDESTDLSEQHLEKTLGHRPPNTTFDIRSWRLQSALATKDGSIPPPSPLKYNFPCTADISDTQSDDTDLSDDSDDDISMPPGLQAPSLTMSTTTVDSSCASTSVVSGPVFQSQTTIGNTLFASKGNGYPRPVISLPSCRRGSPSASSQRIQYHTSNAQHPQHRPSQSVDVAHAPIQCVSSNENGLTVNLDATAQLRTSTLRSSPVPTPLILPNTFVPGPPSISPSPPPAFTESTQRQPSPTSSTSPRPHIKPLPRRTGCAPRPRPPPRSGASAPSPAPGTAPNSSRPSVVLPPSSNPSLGNTTLGSLLRPNPPSPAIPHEIEERLTAMAGRMGVGASSGSISRTGISSNVSRGGTSGSNAFPARSTQFSFGPTSLPRTSIPLGARPAPEKAAQDSNSIPPSS